MNKLDLERLGNEFLKNSKENYISKEIAFRPELSGLKIYDYLLVGIADAKDELFNKLKNPDIIGSHHLLPENFLENANTVISIFLSFSERIRESNEQNCNWPSDEWLHGRIEGQKCVVYLAKYIKDQLGTLGYKCIIPDNRVLLEDKKTPFVSGSMVRTSEGEVKNPYTSNWSERHVGFICGLGTFGLSKNLITKNGSCGRLVSIITDLIIEPDERPYNAYNEYCCYCGKCIENCPVDAIDYEHGKDQKKCADFLNRTLAINPPYYGCGKCQIKVPCSVQKP